ncbi:acyl-CoA dehydrogenase family protein [Candidatus Binatia bacterium]|nr:acyl-CoA dehydrogenase family protein [Candidatus Binatia bacterium]
MTLFSEAHEAFRQRLRAYVEGRLTPNADEWEAQWTLPRSVFAEMGSQGFIGMSRDPAYGGQGLDFGYDVVLAEELPRSKMPGLSLSVVLQNSLVVPLLAWQANDEQKREFLAPAIAGTRIGAVASTEPDGGSDILRGTRCEAVSDGDHWVVTGEKLYITNGPIADFVITLAKTRETVSPTSFTLIIVPTDTPGFRVKESLRKLGMHTSPTGWLAYDACRVPKRLTLGRLNVGFFYHTQNLLEERLMAGVCSVSLGQLILDDTVRHLQRRIVYEAPLSNLQTVRHRIVEHATELEMARHFVYSVCERYRDGKVDAKEICMIKFRVVDMLHDLVTDCMQMQGGAGFLSDNWITRVYRDMRVLSLGGGVSELMKDIIAGYLRL